MLFQTIIKASMLTYLLFVHNWVYHCMMNHFVIKGGLVSTIRDISFAAMNVDVHRAPPPKKSSISGKIIIILLKN